MQVRTTAQIPDGLRQESSWYFLVGGKYIRPVPLLPWDSDKYLPREICLRPLEIWVVVWAMARRPKFRYDSVICVNLNLTKNSKLPKFLRCGSAFFLAPPRLCSKWWKTSSAMCLRKRHIDLGGSRRISWCLSGGAGRGGASQEFPPHNNHGHHNPSYDSSLLSQVLMYYSKHTSCLISLQSHPQDAYAPGPVRKPNHHLAEYHCNADFTFASVPQNIVRFHPSLCQTANGPPSQYRSLRGGCPLICAMRVTFWNETFFADSHPGKPISGRSNGQRPKMDIL